MQEYKGYSLGKWSPCAKCRELQDIKNNACNVPFISRLEINE